MDSQSATLYNNSLVDPEDALPLTAAWDYISDGECLSAAFTSRCYSQHLDLNSKLGSRVVLKHSDSLTLLQGEDAQPIGTGSVELPVYSCDMDDESSYVRIALERLSELHLETHSSEN
eukprot:m.238505 g.238505  ORF g.238505 m.238505 type:complete len:118 (-) comp17429_c0_seq19:692-1045(-)